jgi:hypothetical protein
MFGVAAKTWGEWERRGRVSGGRLVPIPGTPTRVKLYCVDDLRRQLEEFKKGPVFPPDGFVDRHEAARILGMAERTLSTWEREGRVACGRWCRCRESRALRRFIRSRRCDGWPGNCRQIASGWPRNGKPLVLWTS